MSTNRKLFVKPHLNSTNYFLAARRGRRSGFRQSPALLRNNYPNHY